VSDGAFSADEMHNDRQDREQQQQVDEDPCGFEDQETGDPNNK
jgi:hypothetical protein